MTGALLGIQKRAGRFLALSGAAALMALASGTAFAQDATPKAPPAPKAQQDGQGAAANVPESNWVKFCNTDPNSKKQVCLVTQELRTDNGQLMASVAIRDIKGEARRLFMIAVPPGMLIQPGLRVQIDNGKQDQAKYSICFPNACYAELVASDQMVSALKKGNQLMLITLNQQGKPVPFPMSLKNFGKVYDGPAIDPAELQRQQQQLQSELEKKAEAARQKLIDEQKKATQGEAPAADGTTAPAAQ